MTTPVANAGRSASGVYITDAYYTPAVDEEENIYPQTQVGLYGR